MRWLVRQQKLTDRLVEALGQEREKGGAKTDEKGMCLEAQTSNALADILRKMFFRIPALKNTYETFIYW